MAKRNFHEVYNNIMEIAPEELKTALKDSFFPREGSWYLLTMYLNRFLPPSSTDQNTLAIYAQLFDCSIEELKEQFEKQGV